MLKITFFLRNILSSVLLNLVKSRMPSLMPRHSEKNNYWITLVTYKRKYEPHAAPAPNTFGDTPLYKPVAPSCLKIE